MVFVTRQHCCYKLLLRRTLIRLRQCSAIITKYKSATQRKLHWNTAAWSTI